ncbi:MAG: hypothetical protein UU54_C0012G0002 [Candidatus Yanofskybacteria bacterium GW2011_GWA2_41_22]|uniref:Transcriptional regulator n=2 Tax=Parcubacteria group TaxID=1794811 RepID=A0A0G0YL68_9BACT|nr:MAG: hypothetical protein UU54_C0012G0002 [Candidatus Yanofskybacteria bacterium GW2011_GWA2_41_22]KKS25402.1 MAG: hypothetical protein UU83_C0006G0004 [Candidatus Jorgensenbacteria bacterium GW2011_GWF2_41_8]OGN21511.1 MAG: hypothetical protein A3B00_00650 [Candidatus Yanofskybacteria bacterium RIFCSPLOWO2_01_FULL_41_33]
MSGHSKWSQIKHKKGITDKKKSQIFSKLSRLITLAARKGTDPKINSELARAIEHARSFNMPGDNIERAIKKVADKNQAQLEELSVEALGPGGIALQIKAITDNRNRTLSEIRKILSDFEAKMVQPGSIQWLFDQPPVSIENAELQNRIDKLFEALDDQDEVEDIVSNLSE